MPHADGLPPLERRLTPQHLRALWPIAHKAVLEVLEDPEFVTRLTVLFSFALSKALEESELHAGEYVVGIPPDRNA